MLFKKRHFWCANKTSQTFMHEDPSPQKERSTQDVGLTILFFLCFNLSSRYFPRERGTGIWTHCKFDTRFAWNIQSQNGGTILTKNIPLTKWKASLTPILEKKSYWSQEAIPFWSALNRAPVHLILLDHPIIKLNSYTKISKTQKLSLVHFLIIQKKIPSA